MFDMTNSSQVDVIVLIGSLRKESFSRKVANTLVDLAKEPLRLNIVEIGNLPFFNQDLEKTPPQEWVAFRDRIRPANALLFITPEYNRSVPGVLKNAVDVGSRPYGQSVWNAKPGGVVSVSPGAVGGFGSNHHLRQSLVFLNVPTLQQPEAYLGHADKLFDESGKMNNDSTREFLAKYLDAFATWVSKITDGETPSKSQ
jgi:chromate reductase, NAD(P)H dehydrogenase (quinone)